MKYMEDNIIQFPGVGTFLYNDARLYNYEASLRRDGLLQQADLIALCAQLYEDDQVDIDWDPVTGEPIIVSKVGKEGPEKNGV